MTENIQPASPAPPPFTPEEERDGLSPDAADSALRGEGRADCMAWG